MFKGEKSSKKFMEQIVQLLIDCHTFNNNIPESFKNMQVISSLPELNILRNPQQTELELIKNFKPIISSLLRIQHGNKQLLISLFQTFFVFEFSCPTDPHSTHTMKVLQINQKLRFDILKHFKICNNQEDGFKIICTSEQEREKVQLSFFGKSETIEEWRKNLKTLINQVGFEIYFKPIRRMSIGKYSKKFLVRRKADGKVFTVKAFSKKELFLTYNDTQAFWQQIRKLRKMKGHQSILSIENIYESDNSLYIVMQQPKGNALASIFYQGINNQIDFQKIKNIIKKILQGFAHLQKNGINKALIDLNKVILSPDFNEIKIQDYGGQFLCDCQTQFSMHQNYLKFKHFDLEASQIFKVGEILFYFLTQNLYHAEEFQIVSNHEELERNQVSNLLYLMLSKNCEIKTEQLFEHSFFSKYSEINEMKSPTPTNIDEQDMIQMQLNESE